MWPFTSYNTSLNIQAVEEEREGDVCILLSNVKSDLPVRKWTSMYHGPHPHHTRCCFCCLPRARSLKSFLFFFLMFTPHISTYIYWAACFSSSPCSSSCSSLPSSSYSSFPLSSILLLPHLGEFEEQQLTWRELRASQSLSKSSSLNRAVWSKETGEEEEELGRGEDARPQSKRVQPAVMGNATAAAAGEREEGCCCCCCSAFP